MYLQTLNIVMKADWGMIMRNEPLVREVFNAST